MADGSLIWAPFADTRRNSTYVDYKNDQKRHPKKSASAMKPLFESLIKKD